MLLLVGGHATLWPPPYYLPLFQPDGEAESNQSGFFSNLDDIRTEMKRLIAQSKIGDLKLQEMETLIQGLEADRSKLRAKVMIQEGVVSRMDMCVLEGKSHLSCSSK